jgi:hypothetical protein
MTKYLSKIIFVNVHYNFRVKVAVVDFHYYKRLHYSGIIIIILVIMINMIKEVSLWVNRFQPLKRGKGWARS